MSAPLTRERLRSLLNRYVLHADTAPEAEAAWRAFAEENLARVVSGLCVLLSLTILLLWPTDRLVLAGSPLILEAFAMWRPLTVLACVMGAAGLSFIGPVRRHPILWTLLWAAFALFESAFCFAGRAGLESPFPYLSYAYQFMAVPLLLTLPQRATAALIAQGSFLAGLLVGAPAVAHHAYFPFFVLAGLMCSFANVVFGHIVFHLARRTFFQRRTMEAQALRLAEANEKSERLLLNILPAPIAERLKESPAAIADRLGEATVLFADICGFTPLSESLAPEELVQLLNQIFSEFDALVAARGLEKIKTIGDAYMVAGGVPAPRPDHAAAVAELALEMQAAVARFRAPDGRPVQMRIGIHSGPVVAGVIGVRKFSYDLWGDTVNTASRMESHGVVGAIQVSPATRALLGDVFEFEERGVQKVKGKGDMALALLVRRSRAATGS